MDKKLAVSLEIVCEKGLWLKELIEHARSLEFEETPDYGKLRELLKMEGREE